MSRGIVQGGTERRGIVLGGALERNCPGRNCLTTHRASLKGSCSGSILRNPTRFSASSLFEMETSNLKSLM